jgi:lysophospholipase L1-like esterase
MQNLFPPVYQFGNVQPYDRCGTELSLAKFMAAKWGANNSIIVKTAYPGYKLNVDYSPSGYCYPHIATDVNAASAWMNRPITVDGVVVYLGQNDANSTTDRDVYRANMTNLCNNLRSWAGKTNLAVASYGLSTNSTRTYAADIRAIQNSVATNDAYGAILVDDASPLADGVHPYINGYLTLGTNAWSCLTNIWSRN